MFSTYIKKEFYYNASSRSVAVIDIELIFHYILYSFGYEKGTDGADIQRFDPTPNCIKEDFDAFTFEAISLLLNPIFYFFR